MIVAKANKDDLYIQIWDIKVKGQKDQQIGCIPNPFCKEMNEVLGGVTPATLTLAQRWQLDRCAAAYREMLLQGSLVPGVPSLVSVRDWITKTFPMLAQTPSEEKLDSEDRV